MAYRTKMLEEAKSIGCEVVLDHTFDKSTLKSTAAKSLYNKKVDFITPILRESLLTEEGKRLFADKSLNSDERWRKHHAYQTSSVVAQQTASSMLTVVKGKKIDRYSGSRKQFVVEVT